ncbi:MAG: ATP-binding cassette domain-containing protein, partial [Bacteroidales bacterium]|nr:ATP-binding cassette domain-containing protein [Bacteroidales bacterium]
MIRVDDIRKTYENLQVLKGIDLHIDKGTVASIVGASGAGKTTLLQIMGSLERPDSGKVFIDGVDIFSLKAKELARFRNKEIGFIFQFHHLLPEFTALENVMIPALIAKCPKGQARKKATELLDFLGLADRREH